MKNINESGRSMVEMLGVLAIIGVLSIGGIAGYSMAMNRYRANEALDMANKYAVIVFAGKQTHDAMGTAGNYSAPSLYDAGLTTDTASSGTKTPGGAKIAKPTTINEDSVSLTITFPTGGVCKAAQSILGIGSSSSSTSTGCTSSASCSGTGGTITYCFKQS